MHRRECQGKGNTEVKSGESVGPIGMTHEEGGNSRQGGNGRLGNWCCYQTNGLLEEDVWEYKSVMKRKSVGQNPEDFCTNVQKTSNGKSQRNGNRKISEERETRKKTKKGPRQGGSQTPLKPDRHFSISSDETVVQLQESISSTSSKQKKNHKKQSPSKARPVYEGHCPSCQMPFSLLLIETPQWHVMECLDGSKTAEKECPDGLLCISTIPSHYKRYSHFLLAASRAGEYIAELSPYNVGNNFFSLDAAPSISCSSFNDEVLQDLKQSQSLGKPPRQCFLLPKQSSIATNSMDISDRNVSSLENIKEPKHRIQSTGGVKQAECHGLLSQETGSGEDLDRGSDQRSMLISEGDLSDCDISYSPLNTDEEETIETEDEEDTSVVPKIKHFRKRVFDIKSLEDRSERTRIFNKPFDASQPGGHEHNSVKIIHDCTTSYESCEASNSLQSLDGVSKPVSQSSALSRVFNSTGIPDQLKHRPVDQTITVKCKRTVEELEWLKLSPFTFNAGECGWSNSDNCNWACTDPTKGTLFSEFREEGTESFLPGLSDTVEEPSSSLDTKGKSVTGTCKNKLAHNNSYSVREKERKLCNNIAIPVFPCTITKMLPDVSAENTKIQTTHSKELKQMDIGVFFGLQPKAKMESDQKKNLCNSTQTLSPPAAVGKRPRAQKRKAERSVEDSDTITKSSRKNAIPGDPTSGGQRRWTKRFRESCPAEVEARKKVCPFYKKIPGMGFVVDAFQYGEIEGCKAYFLTHFHSDHYGGLTKRFALPIYCNKITGNLVKSKLRVQEQYIHILPMNKECIINGIKVVLLDANHCPGAAMILFVFPNGTSILHTGDFRADPSMERCPFLIGRKVYTLYLDTTYCSPEYTFPSQQEVIQFAVNTAFETVTLNPRTLVVCGTYSVGKEKVFLAIAEVLCSRVSMSKEKYKTLKCLESATISSLITLEWNNTLLHLLPMMQINFKSLQNHLSKFSENFDQILAFKPTGWTYSDGCCSLSEIQPQTKGKISIYGIPYSEHSSFLEMKRFVQWLKPQKIIPTVNVGNWKARNEMEKHFRDWKMEVAGWN
ncbi:DNA cross-link repair 1A protein isoform X2 [Rhineura floridana]|uniref:DNA cross-link repair 1A protein isoform X2 n=1 Tax=Rhineura floridana TaxID=261503 RepID=UPI002AC8447F|nr:DNA cross-link repair 1A protein isoform X2 [Rhineura floridana]